MLSTPPFSSSLHQVILIIVPLFNQSEKCNIRWFLMLLRDKIHPWLLFSMVGFFWHQWIGLDPIFECQLQRVEFLINWVCPWPRVLLRLVGQSEFWLHVYTEPTYPFKSSASQTTQLTQHLGLKSTCWAVTKSHSFAYTLFVRLWIIKDDLKNKRIKFHKVNIYVKGLGTAREIVLDSLKISSISEGIGSLKELLSGCAHHQRIPNGKNSSHTQPLLPA